MGAGLNEASSGTRHLIARHAAGLLWLARYMERIENLARLHAGLAQGRTDGQPDHRLADVVGGLRSEAITELLQL